jgi:hypothetical protein
MISGMKYSPVAPVKWWKFRPASAAISWNIGVGADEAMKLGRNKSARRVRAFLMAL